MRKRAGIGFPGSDPTISHLLAEAELTNPADFGLRSDAIGPHALSPGDNGRIRIMVTERRIGSGEPSLDTLREALIAHFGSHFDARNPTYITRFTDMTRQAETYRNGRVLLAGDAAHIHYPAGGFGMGMGIEDAVNLGWKLALVVRGKASEDLLDSYQSERHPVTERLLRYTKASVALSRTDDRSKALAAIVGELVSQSDAGKSIAAEMSGLSTHYDLGNGHALLGRRICNLDLFTDHGVIRTYELLHDARPVLLDFGSEQQMTSGALAAELKVIHAHCDGAWVLPTIGLVPPPPAVLIRPDGYVAWAGEGGTAQLNRVVRNWFG